MAKHIEDIPQVATKVCRDIEGWLDENTAMFTAELLNIQCANSITGSILEFGVHRGRYLALIYGSCDENEEAVGVDAFFQKLDVPLEPVWRDHAMGVITANVASVWTDPGKLRLLAGRTVEIPLEQLRERSSAGYRFISVDAGHDADSVSYDMALASRLLSKGGIIAVDDLFNPLVPGVAEGFFRWAMGGGGAIGHSVVAYCGNKAFVVKKADYPFYRESITRLIDSGTEYEFVSVAKQIRDTNTANNYEPVVFGDPYICLSRR